MSADGDAATIRDLLDEKPHLEPALREIAAIERARDTPWTFDDIPVDSGRFGELVSRDIVTSVDGGYRLRDPDAVRSALGEDGAESADPDRGFGPGSVSREFDPGAVLAGLRPTMSPVTAGALLAAFGLLFLLRAINYPAVFRSEAVVLPANDPYHYQYWVDRLMVADIAPFALGEVGEFIGGRAVGEPLTYVTGWWFARLLGMDPGTAIAAVAWLPVLSALATGGFIYFMATLLVGDRRVGIAAVAMFAIVPTHAVYSGIGFFDHHTFDYLILAATAAGLVALAVDVERRMADGDPQADRDAIPPAVRGHLRRPATWAVAGGIGVAIVIQVLLWNGSPLLLAAMAGYVACRALSDIRADHPSLVVNAPLVAALTIGALGSHLAHVRWGWQEPMVVYTPTLVLVGAVAVFAAAELVRRLGLPVSVQLGIETGAAGAVMLGVWFLRPAFVDRLRERAVDLFGREGVAETRPMFAADWGIILGPMDHYGAAFFLAAPVLLVAAWWVITEHRPAWLVLVVYGWYLTALAGIQVRFTGELSPFVAVAAGIGLVHLLGLLEVARRPTYDRPSDRPTPRSRTGPDPEPVGVGHPTPTAILYGGLVIVLVVGISVIMLWSSTSFVAIEDDQYETAMWIADDLDEEAAESTFVLSEWSWNRMYNYHVSGDSDTYGYAQQHFEPFVLSTDPDGEQYESHAGTADYIVVEEWDTELPPATTYERVWDYREDRVEGFGRYRAVYLASSEEIFVFELVDGATIQVEGEPDTELEARTTIDGEGFSTEYVRTGTTDEDGEAAITVAHPGTYTVNGESVHVTEAAVRNGDRVTP